MFIKKVKEKMEVKQEVKAKNSSKPRELLHRGLQIGVEKAGKNIREVGEQQKQEEKPQSGGAYAVDKTEVVAKSAAVNAYAMGRKLAQEQKKAKKIQQPKNIPEAEPPGENIPKMANCDEATSASYTVGVGVNLSESTARYVENNGINMADVKLKTKPEEPLAGSLIKNKAPAKLIKEKPSSQILGVTDTKTVWESPIHKVKPYVGVSAENSVETASLPKLPKIKELSNGDIKTKAVAINKAAAANKPNTNTEPLVGTPTGGSAVYSQNLTKQNIKTRANQALAEKANSDKMTKISLEQGRKLATKNLSGKKVQQQFDDVNVEEQTVEFGNMSAAESSSVQEQPISDVTDVTDVTDVNSVNNLSGFEAQSFQQEVGRQQKIANIKTREYEKSRERAVNSVRESNSGRQKVFGKSAIGDVKSAQDNKDKSAVKAGFAGIKEKSATEKTYSDAQQVGCIKSYKVVKYNSFGYFDANNTQTRNKGIKQFVGRLIPKTLKKCWPA